MNQRPLGYEPNELPDCSTPLRTTLPSDDIPAVRGSGSVPDAGRGPLADPRVLAAGDDGSGTMGSVLFLILSIIIGGLVIGALGRLVVPGPNPIGFWWTVACGVGGAVVGGIVARLLFFNPATHWLVTLVIEVVAAAFLVSLVSKSRRRHHV